MAAKNSAATKRNWRADEMRKLPPYEREAILEAAAAALEEEYRTNRSLTDFEAFGPQDLHGDSSNGCRQR